MEVGFECADYTSGFEGLLSAVADTTATAASPAEDVTELDSS